MYLLSPDLAGRNHGVFRKRLVLTQDADLPLGPVGERPTDHGAGRDHAVLANDGMADDGAGRHGDIGHNYAVLHQGACSNGAAGGNDGVADGAIDLAAFRNETVGRFGLPGEVAGRQGVIPGGDLFIFCTAKD